MTYLWPKFLEETVKNAIQPFFLLLPKLCWIDKIALKVSGDEAKEVIDIYLRMLSDLFDYVEADDEIRLTLNYFKTYYAKVKSQL